VTRNTKRKILGGSAESHATKEKPEDSGGMHEESWLAKKENRWLIGYSGGGLYEVKGLAKEKPISFPAERGEAVISEKRDY